jgi:1,4-dihydroxy-6-naphthoate synthase
VTRVRLGLSPCPNDTFLFGPLLEGRVRDDALTIEPLLADVQELNEALAAGRLDVGKASFATALELSGRYGVLPVGSALGFGVGPVLLGPPGRTPPAGAGGALDPGARVLCPGEGTTATLLMRALHPEATRLEQRRFDAIMPALAAGEADLGVCIHEGRFTFQRWGLTLVEDLGASWERLTGLPVPLGGLLARLDLAPESVSRLVELLGRSLAAARAEPRACLAFMRRHAQEMEDDVLWKHVELYVNDHTADLGPLGRRSLEELARRVGRSPPRVLGQGAGGPAR